LPRTGLSRLLHGLRRFARPDRGGARRRGARLRRPGLAFDEPVPRRSAVPGRPGVLPAAPPARRSPGGKDMTPWLFLALLATPAADPAERPPTPAEAYRVVRLLNGLLADRFRSQR